LKSLMSKEFIRNGSTFSVGDVVKLKYDSEFSSWNKNVSGNLGVIVDVKSYSRLLCDSGELVDVLVDEKIIPFEWEDIEKVNENG